MENENSLGSPDDMLRFAVKHFKGDRLGPRLGDLAVRGRNSIPTPNYVASTSRGVVPHLAHDVLARNTNIPATYVALEDCKLPFGRILPKLTLAYSKEIVIEKRIPNAPVLKQPSNAKLRNFIASSEESVVFLGPRRVPRLECPSQNTNSSIAISTSVGFNYVTVEDYIACANDLKPDITTSLVDLVTTETISSKRIEKSADRTHAWLSDTINDQRRRSQDKHVLFASIPPLEKEQQSFYLSDLVDEFENDVSGICLYNPSTVQAVPESLSNLPRLCLDDPQTPQDILRAVALGVDLISVPVATRASEDGIAFDFEFPVSAENSDQPLGIDLWSEEHAKDVSPLEKSCACYTCTRHHKAYIHHLLTAKEMLAWTLLQIHNYHKMDQFFKAIRHSIDEDSFEENTKNFNRTYSLALPQGSGAGPRIRGYQAKSVGGGEPKRNAKAYGRLDEQAMKLDEVESGVVTPDLDALEIEEHGLAEKAKDNPR